MPYATLEQVKQHLRYDDDSNDLLLDSYLHAASAAIDNYITDAVTDQMLPVLRIATLLLCGYYDDNRVANRDMPSDGNYLIPPIRALLYPYRQPTAI